MAKYLFSHIPEIPDTSIKSVILRLIISVGIFIYIVNAMETGSSNSRGIRMHEVAIFVTGIVCIWLFGYLRKYI